MEFLFIVLILIISVIVHEISHGYVADAFGDPTARMAGRLTLNPLPHLDLWGSFILPLLLIMANAGIVFGWAKPVPYNPYNLRNQRWGEALVAGAGPAVNLCIAVLFALLLRTAAGALPPAFVSMSAAVVYINLLLALFNMVPFPPLDGSRVLSAILPYHLARRFDEFRDWMMSYGMLATALFIFAFLFFLWPLFFRGLVWLFGVMTGLPVSVVFPS